MHGTYVNRFHAFFTSWYIHEVKRYAEKAQFTEKKIVALQHRSRAKENGI